MGVDVKKYKYTGRNKSKFKLDDYPTDAGVGKEEQAHYRELTAQHTAKIEELQDKLYAAAEEGVIIALQAMDAAGKDSTIKHVMSGVNPQGVKVTSFKGPNSTELAHDYMWRIYDALPMRGYMGIFNRSHYEDVLVVRVHDLWKNYKMPARCKDMTREEFFEKRYAAIRAWEEHMYNNGYRVLKIFLHESKDTQRDRFMARIEEPTKNWKFSDSDLKERALWDDYMEAYEEAIRATATPHSPWYILPADRKWMTQYLTSCAILDLLEEIDPQYPEMPENQEEVLQAARAELIKQGAKTAEEEAAEKAAKAGKKAKKADKTAKADKKDKKKKKGKK